MRKARSTIDTLYSGLLMLVIFFLSWVLIAVIAFKILKSSQAEPGTPSRKQRFLSALGSMRSVKSENSEKHAD